MAVVRMPKHRTCSSRMRRAPATPGSWEWEGASFHTLLDYGPEIPCCRLMVCTAQESTHLLEHSQPPLLAPFSPLGSCISSVKVGAKQALQDSCRTQMRLSNTEAARSLLSSLPCCSHPSRTEAVGAGPTIPSVFPWLVSVFPLSQH